MAAEEKGSFVATVLGMELQAGFLVHGSWARAVGMELQARGVVLCLGKQIISQNSCNDKSVETRSQLFLMFGLVCKVLVSCWYLLLVSLWWQPRSLWQSSSFSLKMSRQARISYYMWTKVQVWF